MRTIHLTKGKAAIVDDQDYDRVTNHSWYAMETRTKWYAATRMGGKIVLMHRMITDAPTKTHVDHWDGDGLHNWRSNLRVCTPSQNGANRGPSKKNHGYKGVYKIGNRWAAYIRPHGVRLYLGCFKTPEDGARAYDAKAREIWGEFAFSNFPEAKAKAKGA